MMTDNNNFHLPRIITKDGDEQQRILLDADQPNPQIVIQHYHPVADEQIVEDHLIEEEHYEEEIDESNIISEVIDDDQTTTVVQLTQVAADTCGGPPSTIIHKPSSVKKLVTSSSDLSAREISSSTIRAPKSFNTSINKGSSNHQYQSFIGRLVSKDNILLISQNVIEIGRNSSKSAVDFHVGKNSFVSRKHLILHYDGREFNLVCASKNGVFIDDQFIRKSNEPTKLPPSWVLPTCFFGRRHLINQLACRARPQHCCYVHTYLELLVYSNSSSSSHSFFFSHHRTDAHFDFPVQIFEYNLKI